MQPPENKLAQELVRHHIRPSHQRIALLTLLRERSDHPTVDEIFRDLKPEIPTLSKSTVYNTLQVLCERNLVRALTIEDNEVRYDAIPSNHGHFKCRACGKVENFTVNFDQLNYSGLEDHQIRQRDVFFHGLCPDCLNGQENMED